jgi:hypothetical protein
MAVKSLFPGQNKVQAVERVSQVFYTDGGRRMEGFPPHVCPPSQEETGTAVYAPGAR